MKKFVLLALLNNASAVKLANMMKQGGGPPMPSGETAVALEMAGIHELEKDYMDHEAEIEEAIREAEEELEHDLEDYGIEDVEEYFPDPEMMVHAGEKLLEEAEAEAEASKGEQIQEIEALEAECEQEAAANGIELAQTTQDNGLPDFVPPVEAQYGVIRSIIKDAQMELSRPGLDQELDEGFKGLRDEVKRETGDDLGPPPPGEAVLKDLRGLFDKLNDATSDEQGVEKELAGAEAEFLHEAEKAAREVERAVEGFVKGLGVDGSQVGMSPTADATFLLDTIDAMARRGDLDGAAALIAQGADAEGGDLRPQDVREGIERAVGDARREVEKPGFDEEMMRDEEMIIEEEKELEHEAEAMI